MISGRRGGVSREGEKVVERDQRQAAVPGGERGGGDERIGVEGVESGEPVRGGGEGEGN